MQQSSKRLSSIIIALILLVVAFIVFFQLVEPAYGSMETLKGQVVGEQTLLANDQALVTSIKSLVSTYQGQSTSQQLVNLALPVGQDNSQALGQIYGLGANNGIAIQSVGVTVQAAQAPANTTTNSAATPGVIVKQTGSITYIITGTGSYESFKSFLQGIQTNTRLFNVTGVTIRPTPSITSTNSQSANTQDLFTYTITVVAYYQTP
jgi:hypothetical protein